MLGGVISIKPFILYTIFKCTLHIYIIFFNVICQLDDWVLCRIYKKSHALSAISAASDQEQEEEEAEQFIQDALLPALKSPPSNNNYNTTLQPQKSCSFSNLLDAMDYSMLSSLLADNTTGFESSNSFSFGNYQLEQPDQVNNYTNISSSSNNMFLQKLPQLNSPVPNMENKLKRQYSGGIDEDYLLQPSKKLISSCSYRNSSSQSDMAQHNFLNQSFFNQSLLLSPHIQFQGWNKDS